MLTTTRKPASVAEIQVEEFMEPLGLTQTALAAYMSAPRKNVNEFCNDRRPVTAPAAHRIAMGRRSMAAPESRSRQPLAVDYHRCTSTPFNRTSSQNR